MMKFGIKQKILFVVIGVLTLTTGLDALLASYFTNRQSEQQAFADLERDLRTWQSGLELATIRLREVALDAVGDAVILNQLAELVTLELNLSAPDGMRESSEAERTLAYNKSVSLNRLHLVLRTGGFTSITVYTGGRLSHYVSASEAGMVVRKGNRDPMWVAASADSHRNLPFQSWPAWSEAVLPPFVLVPPPAALSRPTVSFNFQSPHDTRLEIAVPVQGVSENIATDAMAQPLLRFVSELAIARPAAGHEGTLPGRHASTVAVVVFQKLIDHAALQLTATTTGKLPALFSPDGKHRQLADATATDLWDARALQAAMASGINQQTVTTRQGSFYQALLPWHFEGETRLILGLASSRASTLQNIRQTLAAILTVAGLVLLVSISLGMFWMSRYIDPIIALTAAAKKMGMQRQLQTEPAASDRTSSEELRRIAVAAPDEVGDLANAFNAMIAELRQSLETLEQRVQDRTAELRQQTRYLRTLIDTLPLLAWLKDTKSRYLAVNQATADACGRTVEEVVGKSDLELWPRELAEAYRADDADAMMTRQRKTVEERLADVKGTIWIETYKAPVLDDDGTVLGTVGAARNISDRKAAEVAREAALAEAERLARLRSEFLAQMSHELRTPLNAILGYAQILQLDRPLTDRQARGLATIQQSGHHLLTLINDILDLSRISASKLELHPADINLAAFLRVVSDIIRVDADAKNLAFTYQAGADLPVAVRVDEKRLRQVLLNLLGNAVKFTDRGHVVLRVQAIAVRAPTEDHSESGQAMARLLFEVEDSGIGMTEQQLKRIFLPFEQVADVKRRHGGAGLGLPISRELVRLMGGDIQVRSEAGSGSTFRFELDVPIAAREPVTSPTQRNAIGYAGPRKRILIVDDSLQSRAMLIDLLGSLGFDVVEATNGEEAIDQAQRVRPDFIVMDIAMPLMDGLAATQRLRRTPEFAQVPILIASASASSEDESRSLAAGASAFVPKPIDLDRLLKTIGEHLAVEWIYEEISDEPELAASDGTDEIVIPPREEMDVLHRLALAGNMRDIGNRANYLKDLDPRYRPFVQRLQSLVQRYQSQAILTLVERCKAQVVSSDRNSSVSLTGPSE
jgi:PAS domain S-box-containing protein